MDTKARVLDVALASFATSGYSSTSLDDLAGQLGVRKQTILYHYSSKESLLDAVVDRCADEVIEALLAVVDEQPPGWVRVELLVRSVFRLALERPELLGLLREVSRPGSPASSRLQDHLDPLLARAQRWFEDEMAAGRMRRVDARLMLLSAYSTVLGVATEVEVLRAAGVDPTLRALAIRRRELLRFLRSALVAG